MARTPTPGTAAALIAEYGIEVLRGVPLQEGGAPVLYVSNALIDKIIAEAAADEDLVGDTRLAWRERLYGGETPDADMVVHINPNTIHPADPDFRPQAPYPPPTCGL